MSKVIAIGALGGSGTRAVAQVLIDAGIYMGDDLNRSNDNLIFTRLFKNPEWYVNANKEEIISRMDLFNNYMKHNKLSIFDIYKFANLSIYNPTITSYTYLYYNILRKYFSKKHNRNLWGWKEPNTHLFIFYLDQFFYNLKYIHVVRHGLDMAFSKNKQQLKNWGHLYNIFIHGDESIEELTYKQLDYWIMSTKDTLKKTEYLTNGCLIINHGKFCTWPEEEIRRIFEYLDLEMSVDTLNKLSKIPKLPSSYGRYKKHDLSIFDQKQLDFVKEMGFDFNL